MQTVVESRFAGHRFFDEASGGVAFDDGDDGDFSTPGFDLFCADYGVFVVVAALYDDVGFGGQDELHGGGLAEDGYGVDGGKSGEDAGAGVFGDDGPGG